MVAKKTVAKKPVKRSAAKTTAAKKSVRKAKKAPMQSFRVYKNPEPFTTFKITRQTMYWTVLAVFIIVTQLWILSIQLDIANLTNSLVTQ